MTRQLRVQSHIPLQDFGLAPLLPVCLENHGCIWKERRGLASAFLCKRQKEGK